MNFIILCDPWDSYEFYVIHGKCSHELPCYGMDLSLMSYDACFLKKLAMLDGVWNCDKDHDALIARDDSENNGEDMPWWA